MKFERQIENAGWHCQMEWDNLLQEVGRICSKQESCKTQRWQDFKGKAHPYIPFVLLVTSVVALWLLHYNKMA